eukprot:gene36209-59267_t
MSDETRMIRAGALSGPLVKTVGPPIQKGSTVLLPNAAALYDDDNYVTYGRSGLSAQASLRSALAELEGASGVTLYPSGILRPLASNLNYRPGQIRSNAAITRVGLDGSVDVYTSSGDV